MFFLQSIDEQAIIVPALVRRDNRSTCQRDKRITGPERQLFVG
jgi:hypothetical protein